MWMSVRMIEMHYGALPDVRTTLLSVALTHFEAEVEKAAAADAEA